MTVFVTGEVEPAENFLKLAIGAITWAIQQISLFPIRRGLAVEINEVLENTGYESEEHSDSDEKIEP